MSNPPRATMEIKVFVQVTHTSHIAVQHNREKKEVSRLCLGHTAPGSVSDLLALFFMKGVWGDRIK